MIVDRTPKQSIILPAGNLLRPIGLLLALAAAFAGAWITRSAPLDPPWARGLLRLDGLAVCFSALAIALAMAQPRRAAYASPADLRHPVRTCFLLCGAFFTTHLAVLSVGLLGAALLNGPLRRWERWAAALAAASGLTLIAVRAGTWRYPTPNAGLGLNSLSFGLILLAVLLAAGAPALLSARRAAPAPLLALGMVYTLYRLFSFGPWNLGWMLAALLIGAALALAAAWQIALSADQPLLDRLTTLHIGLAVIGGGLASGAGLAAGVSALLALAIQQAALYDQPATGRRLWLVSGAVPLTVPFMAGWIGIAGAMAGGITALAIAIWAALLLTAAGIARLAEGSEALHPEPVETDQQQTTNDDERSSLAPDPASPALRLWLVRRWIAPFLSLALGIATPAVFTVMIQPMTAQLQGGLTPFGEVTVWPWAGLLALNAARQPVATLPSLALAGLMVILAALAWLCIQFIALRRGGKPDET